MFRSTSESTQARSHSSASIVAKDSRTPAPTPPTQPARNASSEAGAVAVAAAPTEEEMQTEPTMVQIQLMGLLAVN